ncbi:hypothetical protein AB1Y20_016671 [Prymnesium parvum]|uniref:H(+)-exporting diphosphatase n=1 Tax=Prymnesium parvum TaxID=97485 RepID=A0AB34IAJ1_PRYPA
MAASPRPRPSPPQPRRHARLSMPRAHPHILLLGVLLVCATRAAAYSAHGARLPSSFAGRPAAPMLARLPHSAPSAARVEAAVVAQYAEEYAEEEEPVQYTRSGGAGLLISAAGLAATICTAATSLSMTGVSATIFASIAGLFAFKLSKELSLRGVSQSYVQRTARFGLNVFQRLLVAVGALLVRTLAALVSLLVLILTKLGETVIFLAEVASRIKPDLLDGHSQTSYQPSGYSEDSTPFAKEPPRSAPLAPAAPPPPPTIAEEREIGQRLAMEQMMRRSQVASAKRLDPESSSSLKSRQDDAMRKVFESRRADQVPGRPAPASAPPRPRNLSAAYRASSTVPRPPPSAIPRPPITTAPRPPLTAANRPPLTSAPRPAATSAPRPAAPRPPAATTPRPAPAPRPAPTATTPPAAAAPPRRPANATAARPAAAAAAPTSASSLFAFQPSTAPPPPPTAPPPPAAPQSRVAAAAARPPPRAAPPPPPPPPSGVVPKPSAAQWLPRGATIPTKTASPPAGSGAAPRTNAAQWLPRSARQPDNPPPPPA